MEKYNFAERSAKTRMDRFKNFVSKAIEKHGVDRYDYTFAEKDYVTSRSRVRLICNICKKEFMVMVQDHISKQKNRHGGCPVCFYPGPKISNLQKKRWDASVQMRRITFLERAKEKHKDRYAYPNLQNEYKKYTSKISIICKICGHTFSIKANCHISKNRYGGCPKCNKIKMREKIMKKNHERQKRNQKVQHLPHPYGCIYKIIHEETGRIYIGYTTLTIERRFKSHFDTAKSDTKKKGKATSYVHRALIKYGKDNFRIEPIREFHNVSPLFLAGLEKRLIKKLKPEFNISPGGEIGNRVPKSFRQK
jgi:rubrerythrin